MVLLALELATQRHQPQLMVSVISNGTPYGWSFDQNRYAWNLTNGKVDCSIALPSGDWAKVMAIGGDRLLASCNTGDDQSGPCALNPKTGKSPWTYGQGNEGQIFAPPVISGNRVYFPTGYIDVGGSNFLAAANVKTGASVWTFGSWGTNCVTRSVPLSHRFYEAKWWARQGLNLRPLPCEGSLKPSYSAIFCQSEAFSTDSPRARYGRVCRLRVRTFFDAPAFGFSAFGVRGSGIAVVFFNSSIAKAPLTSRKCTARVSFWLTSL